MAGESHALTVALRRIWDDPRLRAFARMGAAPMLFYFACFSLLTFPLITQFSSHFFTDQGDGLQNVWNMWWVNEAVTHGQSPWSTHYLHRPWGVTLLSHTLNPFNGFLGIGLQTFLTLRQAHNVIVVFSFVMGGVTAFWLSWRLVRSYWPSVLAGFIFTFSNYHFAHAQGHLQLVSLEWIPLFLLCWHVLITRPGWRVAVAAGLSLCAVILCDYYYFFYCVMAGALMLFWFAWRSGHWRFLIDRQRLVAIGVFVGVLLVTAGPLAFSLLWLHIHDPLQGVHRPGRWSADLLSSVIPGGHWYFADWTRFYWSRLPGNIHEKSVHLGVSVLAMMIWVGLARRRVRVELGVWVLLLGFFWVVALGPAVQIAGYEISWLKMPYALLEVVFPPIEMSGCPVRMTVMVTLAAALICAVGFDLLLAGGRRARIVAVVFLAVLVFEYWPRPMPSNSMPLPDHVRFLSLLPKDRVIIDRAASGGRALYFQTVHRIPMALGYTSRIPKSLMERERALIRAAKQEDFAKLRSEWGIHYLLNSDGRRTAVIDTGTGEMVFPPPK